jgi:hypothetical protein
MDDYIYFEAAADPPPGVQPNFEHPPGSAIAANAIVIIALITVTLFAWMRLYTKIYIIHRLHTEDCKVNPLSYHCANSLIRCRSNPNCMGKSRRITVCLIRILTASSSLR